MMDYLDREKIEPPQTTAEEFTEAMEDARMILKKGKPSKE
jgi:hypothetical protein